jgi:hypothetical protein
MGWNVRPLGPHEQQNFIDGLDDNKSYQYCLPIYLLILKKSISQFQPVLRGICVQLVA